MGIYTENEIRKVVLQKKQQGGGKGGKKQPTPDNVIVETIDSDDDDIDETQQPKDEEGQDKEGQDKEGEDKGKEGQDGQDKGKEGGEDGEDGQGKDGQGKDGQKGGKGGDGNEKSEDYQNQKDIEAIKKAAKELLEEMDINPNHISCGSVEKREQAQKSMSEKDPDIFEEEVDFLKERIKNIMEKAAENGIQHPLRQSNVGRGTGGSESANAPKGDIIPMPMKSPEFLRKLANFAKSEYEKEYFKKGTDWVWSGSGVFNDSVFFKDRPKVSIPKKAIFLMVDVSGSMFGDFGGTGKSLLEHLIGYLPTIAKDFTGQVWWISNGILHWQKGDDYTLPDNLVGKPAKTDLSFFKDKSAVDLSLFFRQVKGARGSGGGTTFNRELQAVQDLREEGKNLAPIIVLTDGEIDKVATEYSWPAGSAKKIVGKLPPNTYFMTDPHGISYMKRFYNDDPKEGYFDYKKNIQYYDITENGKYKVELNKLGKW